MKKIILYLQLMRLNKPIGIFLLLWPTLWALWIASAGSPNFKISFIFIAGVILMRSAGCVINDFADRNFDHRVNRTQYRPLTAGKVTKKEALMVFAVLCVLAFILVLQLNIFTIMLSLVALGLAIIYPFMKRYTHWAQLFLGFAFGWGIPMVFAAQTNQIPLTAWILLFAAILWTLVYDTEYAMVDQEDDLKIGIKSTAILFGNNAQLIIGIFQIGMLVTLCLLGWILKFSAVYYVCLVVAGLGFLYQQKLLASQDTQKYFKAFLDNNWIGIIIFIGIVLHYQLH